MSAWPSGSRSSGFLTSILLARSGQSQTLRWFSGSLRTNNVDDLAGKERLDAVEEVHLGFQGVATLLRGVDEVEDA